VRSSLPLHPLSLPPQCTTNAEIHSRRGFKALKQSTKLLYLRLHRPLDALKTYKELLTYTKSAVTRNYSEKTINGILDYVGGGKGGGKVGKGGKGAPVELEVEVLGQFYEATKVALKEAKNDVGDLTLGWSV
jgi:COP9 signalosome complex subunit 2